MPSRTSAEALQVRGTAWLCCGSWEAALGWPQSSAVAGVFAQCAGAPSLSTVQLGPDLPQRAIVVSGSTDAVEFWYGCVSSDSLSPKVEPF